MLYTTSYMIFLVQSSQTLTSILPGFVLWGLFQNISAPGFTGGVSDTLHAILLELCTVLIQCDGDMFSALLTAMGIGYLGIGALYALWCLARQAEDMLDPSTVASTYPRICRSR